MKEWRQLTHGARLGTKARTDEFHAQRFDGIAQYTRGSEQVAIRRFRRSIEETVGIDCDTIDDASYDPPTIELGRRGVYELRMPCRTRELVISFPKAAAELRSPGE